MEDAVVNFKLESTALSLRPHHRRSQNVHQFDEMNIITKRHASRVPIPLFIPNILCYIRIILAFASIYTSSKISSTNTTSSSSSTTRSSTTSKEEDTSPMAFFYLSVTAILWIISSLLDHLDGKLARKYNQCSDLGVLLDIIADNILRSCSWISCLIALLNQQGTSTGAGTGAGTGTDALNHKDIFRLALVAVIFTSMEWMTMLSMQMIATLKRKSHWKLIPLEEIKEGTTTFDAAVAADEGLVQNNDNNDKPPPWWIETIFRKSFYNPLGVITIYGSMSAGMMHFLHLQREVLLDFFPSIKMVLEGARMTAYIGRLLALCCEMYFCLDFLRLVVRLDARNKVRT